MKAMIIFSMIGITIATMILIFMNVSGIVPLASCIILLILALWLDFEQNKEDDEDEFR